MLLQGIIAGGSNSVLAVAREVGAVWVAQVDGGRRALRRRLKRVELALAATPIGLSAGGSIYQRIATARDRRRFPAPGRMVDAGGHRLHLLVMGQEHVGPTVLLEAGLMNYSGSWAWVQPAVAQSARVVAYDRAG